MSEKNPVKMGFEGAGAADGGVGDLLWVVHAASVKILEFSAGNSLETFENDDLLRAAVGQMLVICGDQLGRMQRSFPEEFGKLEHGVQVIALADDLQVDSSAVGSERVWRMVDEVVPDLMLQSRDLLEAWHGG